MVHEIANFLLVLVLLIAGFVLSMYYIIGKDLNDEDTLDELGGGSQLSSIAFYCFEALFAAQEWSVLVSNEETGFDSARSRLAEGCMILLSVFGTLIMMNLLSNLRCCMS